MQSTGFEPASLVNCPLHCNTATANNKSSPTIKAPVCLILQLRPKIGLERRGPPWLVIGFLIVCLAIGSTPCTQICNRSICGGLPDNRCNFGQNTGWRCNFVFKWERNELISFALYSRVIVYISSLIHQSRDFLVTTMT